MGTHEYVSFPEWGVAKLKAKVDTGAKNSALHVEEIKLLDARRVGFAVRLDREDRDRSVRVTAPIARRGRVRSSTGVLEERTFVRAVVRVGAAELEIELSLVDRAEMLYRMLLGRETLKRGDFLVDVGRRYVQKPTPRRRRQKG